MNVSVFWFRRDLRLADNPALLAALQADATVPLFVFDDALWKPAGPARRAYLLRSLHALDERLDGHLHVRHGDPVRQVVQVARKAGADQVHVAADYGPYGGERDRRVEQALAEHDVELVRTGSPYAIAPGMITNKTGDPYKVFTPYHRAWAEHGWRAPAGSPRAPSWHDVEGASTWPAEPAAAKDLDLPEAGEEAARKHWRAYRDDGLDRYDDDRNSPAVGGSRMSVHLKWGELHPRTILADLGEQTGQAEYRRQLAWRDFYAGVLAETPSSAREDLNPLTIAYDHGKHTDELVDAWEQGRTGYPIVDAGMRQLAAEGWVHNRVRMIVASFLTKDLHVWWPRGARVFMRGLVDGDLASNNHGWQWVAGTGTDAAPYFRVFNPSGQGKKFDPDGAYVRRWVPELADVPAKYVHEPWESPDGLPDGYPERVVDHAEERRETLARYEHRG